MVSVDEFLTSLAVSDIRSEINSLGMVAGVALL
jgi:hypothetical protein